MTDSRRLLPNYQVGLLVARAEPSQAAVAAAVAMAAQALAEGPEAQVPSGPRFAHLLSAHWISQWAAAPSL